MSMPTPAISFAAIGRLDRQALQLPGFRHDPFAGDEFDEWRGLAAVATACSFSPEQPRCLRRQPVPIDLSEHFARRHADSVSITRFM